VGMGKFLGLQYGVWQMQRAWSLCWLRL